MSKIIVSQQSCPRCRGTGEIIPEHGTVEGPGVTCPVCGGYKEVILIAGPGYVSIQSAKGEQAARLDHERRAEQAHIELNHKYIALQMKYDKLQQEKEVQRDTLAHHQKINASLRERLDRCICNGTRPCRNLDIAKLAIYSTLEQDNERLAKENHNLRETIKNICANCLRDGEFKALEAARDKLYKEREEEARNVFDLQQENHGLTMRISRLVKKEADQKRENGRLWVWVNQLRLVVKAAEKFKDGHGSMAAALNKYSAWQEQQDTAQ